MVYYFITYLIKNIHMYSLPLNATHWAFFCKNYNEEEISLKGNHYRFWPLW